MADPQQANPVPPAPDIQPAEPDLSTLKAPNQKINVRALTGENRGRIVQIPAETYQYFAQSGDVDAVLPTVDAKGVKHWTNVKDWKSESTKGFKVDFDDRDQIPAAYQLTKELQDRDPDAVGRFLAPFWGIVLGSLPHSVQMSLQGRANKSSDYMRTALEVESGVIPSIPSSIYQLHDIWNAWVQAAKLPTAEERNTAGISALPIPGVPNIASGFEDVLTGNWAGAMGEGVLLGAMAYAGRVYEAASEAWRSTLDRWIPDVTYAKRSWRNVSLQREVVNQLNKVAVPDDVANRLRAKAGGQVQTAAEQELARKQALDAEADEAGYHLAAGQLGKSLEMHAEEIEAEQARREGTLESVNQSVNRVAGPSGMTPNAAADRAIEIINDVKRPVDDIETGAYEPAFQMAESAGIQTDLTPVGNAIVEATRSMNPAQEKLGVSSVDVRDLEGARKMGAYATGMNRALEAYQYADVDALSPNQQEAVRSFMNQMQGQGGNQLPFKVTVEAERGLSSAIRKMQQSHNSELAPRIRLLRVIRNSLRAQNEAALADHPEIGELYDQAKRVTTEQNTLIGDRYIRRYFGDPRYREAGETLVARLLAPGREKLARLLNASMEVGPQARTGLEMVRSINPEEAERISQRIEQVTQGSEQAKQGLRRMVTDAMMKAGEKPSTTPGIDTPTVDFNKMEAWLRARPAAKILLGDGYQPLLDEITENAARETREANPEFDKTMQRLTAIREGLERKGQKRASAMAKKEAESEKVRPPYGATVIASPLKPITEGEFVGKLKSDPAFRSWAKQNTTPAEQRAVLRSIIQQAIDASMEQGRPGQWDAIMNFEKFGKEMAEAESTLSAFGNPEAVRILRGLGRVASRAELSGSVGIIGRPYFWYKGPFRGPVPEPRLSAGLNLGPLKIGPQEMLAKVGDKTLPVKLPAPQPSMTDDILQAASDPKLTKILNDAMALDPQKAGAGIKALRFYLAFGSAGRRVEKPKIMPEDIGNAIMEQANGDIDRAVSLAQALGYTR